MGRLENFVFLVVRGENFVGLGVGVLVVLVNTGETALVVGAYFLFTYLSVRNCFHFIGSSVLIPFGGVEGPYTS